MCKLFPEVSRRARLTRVIGQRGQTRAVIGRGSGLAGAGRGRKLTGTMAATVPLRDRLSFLHRLPILLKGTSDDDVPCPGYLFEEIAKITHESLGSSQCLLEYLLSRLQSGSGRVKLKVLKIMLHLCGHGSSSFLLILKRNPAFIQEAAGLLLRALVSLPLLEGLWEDGTGEAGRRGGALACRGPGDSFHRTPGSSPREQLVPEGAGSRPGLGGCLVLGRLVTSASFPATQGPASSRYASMGSQSRPQSSLQGFGYSKERGHTGSAGEAFLSTIQKAAEVVASAMRPGPESPSSQRSLLRGDAYQPAVTPSAGLGPPTPGNPLPTAGPGARAMRHQPGQAGGGWEELDSSPNSQDSSQENDDLGKASDSGSPSGSDSPSGASRAPSDLAERVEAVILSDCQQELSLVRAVTRGPHCFLSREEVQHFVKECGLLNCEAVLELLIRHLGATSERVQMRALGAIASLGCTDLLSQERVLLLARPRLQELSVGSPGPVTNKATKILRHFEASCRQWPPAQRPPAEPGPAVARVGPSDLLTDTLPFTGGQGFLQPLSSALFSSKGTAPPSGLQPGPVPPTSLEGCPLPARADAREAKTRLAGSREQGAGSEWGPFGTDTAKRGPELDPGPGDSCDSLFAGMELVACPRLVGAGTAAEEPLPACQAPWTSSQRVAAKEPSGSEPSAFAFLNS
ncbi:AP-4 complex accessory subunit tepsin isoform X4 [Sagmatias obliquidens]|uniref:AP-4 complex accessory subunit tepsin isoform X4 n=1 Tax=Sagmatias obliquidens TaxID=3371155 RepID=UPI000F4421A5|nr:AP-4 complex accessory subunit tepsin isoform X4 [Lagenorhynchus obliquidens]